MSHKEKERETIELESNSAAAITFHEFCKLHRHEEILKEFEFIIMNPLDGVHVFPSLKSLQVWYGVIFIRTGPYAEGIFHFKVILSDDYPYTRPSIRFDSNVYHNEVSTNGTFNLKNRSPSWSKCKSQIWEALYHMRQSFYHPNIPFSSCNSSGKDAIPVLDTNKDKFMARARSCVLESLMEFEEQETDITAADCEADNPFNCRILSPRSNSSIKRTFLIKAGGGNTNEIGRAEDDLLSWTKHTFEKMIVNISNYSMNGTKSPQNRIPPGL
eukprot:gene10722-11870_t